MISSLNALGIPFALISYCFSLIVYLRFALAMTKYIENCRDAEEPCYIHVLSVTRTLRELLYNVLSHSRRVSLKMAGLCFKPQQGLLELASLLHHSHLLKLHLQGRRNTLTMTITLMSRSFYHALKIRQKRERSFARSRSQKHSYKLSVFSIQCYLLYF